MSIRATRPLSPVLLIMTIAGCGWFGGSDSRLKISPLVEFTPALQAAVAWRVSLNKGANVPLRPAVHGGRVYAASPRGEVVALESASGRQFWRVDVKQSISAGVGAADGVVVVGTNKGEVIAFNEDGKERWRSQLTTETFAPPQIAGDMVIARTTDGSLFGLSASDGKRKWLQQRTNPALTLRNVGAVTIADGVVYAGFAGGKLTAVTLDTGDQVWEVSVAVPRGATELERVADVASQPTLDGSQLCAVAYQGRLACFDAQKGTPDWSREVSSAAGLARGGRNVYVTDDRGVVLAFQSGGGTSVWKQEKLEGRKVTGPAVLNEWVAVGDFEGYVHILSTADGRFLARVPTDGRAIVSTPVIADRGFIVQTARGGIFAISLQ